jgi:hypothetical protein
MPRNDLIQLRQGIENQWSFANPVLESGEPGYATDTKILKIGDGINGWNSLSSVSQLDVVYTTGDQSIGGTKTFTSQPVFNNGILVGGTSRFTIGAGAAFDFSIDRGDVSEGFTGDVLKFDVDNTNGAGYATTLQSNAPIQHITVRLPDTSGTLALDKRNMIAGSGLVGGGTISADRTFNIGQGDGITVSADNIAVDSNVVVRTTGSQNISGTKTFNNNVIVTGQFSAVSGYFKNYLSLNGTGVSISGHTHTVSDITNFGSGVSGLLPVKDIIAGSGIQVGAVSGAYTITAFGVAASSASSLITKADNKTGSTISKMSVVYISGGHGNRPTIQKSIASAESTSSKTYGITASDINDNQTGDIVIFGALIDVNTDQFGASLGSTLYLSPSISGGITATKPLAPNHLVAVGKIIRNHVNQGIIEVSIQNGFELYELHDVAVTGVTDGQFLQYNSNSGLWVPSSSGNFSTLLVNNTGVSITGHTHQIYEINNLQSTLNNKQPTGVYVSLTGVESISGTKTFLNNVAVTGQFSSVSGYFKDYLSLNGTGVSITGHTHQIYQINNLQSELNNKQPTGNYISLTGVESVSGTKTFLNNIVVTGQFSSVSGYFKDYLSLNGTGVSITGHTHEIYQISNLQSTLNNKQPTGLYVSLTGIETISGVKTFANAIIATGGISSPTGIFNKLIANGDFELNGSMNINVAASILANGAITFIGNPYVVSGVGYFTSGLFVGPTGNATPVSLSGHQHTYNNISNFCTGVAECVNTPLLAGTGISLSFVSGTGLYIHFTGGSLTISNTGISAISGYFRDYLSLNGTGVSITGHTHQIYEITNLQSSLNNKQPTGVYVSLTGIESISGTKTFLNNVVVTGQFSSVSGYFKDYLALNGTGVSITGHSHQIYQITNLQSSLDNKQPTGLYVSLTGVESISGTKTFNNNVVVTGQFSSVSGYFKDYLSLNGTGVSITGHSHQIYQITNLQSSLDNKQPTGVYVSLTGIESISGSKTFTQPIFATGGISSVSGYFKDYLSLNGSGISLTGHTHTVSDITNFNSGVSGLLPTGTVNYISKFGTGGSGLNNSSIFDNGTSVGISTSSISSSTKLEVNGTIQQTWADGIRMATVYDNNWRMGINYGASSRLMQIFSTSNDSGGDIAFNTRLGAGSSATDYGTEKMRITSSGRIGIGTTIPSSQLHVVGSGFFSSGLAVTGLITSNNGNFIDSLRLNGTGVSISGHTHTSSDITNFNSGVSGLVSGIYAPLSSPALIGTPTVPTAASGTNTTQIASTSFVRTEISNLVASAPATLDTLNELASALGNDASFSTTITTNLAGKANLSGATFTGSVSGPSGNFTSLKVNSVDVSASGHTHTVSNITNFGSGVSGLLPSNLVYTTGAQRIEGLKSFDGNAEFGTGFQTGFSLGDSLGPGGSGAGLMDSTIPLATEYWNGSDTIIHYAYGGGTLSSPRITILESNGNVGIGTSSPSSKLHVAGDVLATGSFIAGSGSAANPSFEFAGDIDTGLFSPTANTLAVSTSGVERLRIDNSGNMGIGTTVPGSKLTIGSGIGAGVNVNSTTGYDLAVHHGDMIIISPEDISNNPIYTGITLFVSRPGGYQGGQSTLDFASRDRGNNFDRGVMARIVGGNTTNAAANSSLGGELSLQTAPTGSSTPTSRLFINRDGNIGIGNSSPNGRLHVLGTGLVDGRLSVSPTTAVTSPLSVLHVSGSVTDNASLMISGPTATRSYLGVGNSDTIPFFSSLNGDISASTYGWGFFDRGTDGNLHLQRKGGASSWSSVMMISRSNGNIGIGTGVQATTPPEKLTVDGNIRVADIVGTQGNVVQFNRGGGGQYDYTIGRYGSLGLAISLSNDSSSQRPLQVGFHSGITFLPRFHVNGYTGAVGINTTTPSGYLDVAGDVFIRGNPGTAGRINFKSSTFADTLLNIRSDTAGNIYMDGGGAAIKCGSQDGQLDVRGYSTNVQIGHTYNAGTIAQHVRFTPGASELMRMTTSGTIGIGLPLTSSLFNIQPFDNCRLHIMGSGANSSSSALNVANSGNNSLLFVRNDGNVGVGTTNPNSQLHVVGSGLFSGDVTSSGSFIGGSGTAALPSFEFIGDPDTGLFSPASNTFSISTSGVERLRINNVGNIGIGTTNYAFNNLSAGGDANLSINSTAWIHNALQIGPVDNGYDYTWITNGAAIFNTVGVGEKVDYPGNAVVMSTNGLTVNNAGGLGGSACQLLPDQGAIIENSLIINSNANGGATVGIGTSSPGSPLTIATNSAAGTIAGASQTQIFQVNDASSSDYVNLGHFNCESNLSRGSFTLSNNGSNAAWEDNCLQFFAHGSSYGYGYYGSNTSDAGCAMIVTQGSEIVKLQIGNYNAAPIEFFTNNTFRIRIDTSGNLGIGTAIPSSKLHVIGDINCNSINIVSATGVTVSSSGLNNIWSREVSISGARSFTAKLSAYNATNTAAAGWNIRGLVKRLNTGNPSIVGTNIVEKWNDTTFTISTANVITSGTSLVIQVSGFPTSSTSVRADISYT